MARSSDIIYLRSLVAAREMSRGWQGRALRRSYRRPIGVVILSVLAHTYPTEQIELMCKMIWPGWELTTPFVCSAAKLDKAGHIVADMQMGDDQAPSKNVILYDSEIQMRDVFRKFADRIGLSDSDRVEMFGLLRLWVVADTRLDPTMHPADPDAKRLVH